MDDAELQAAIALTPAAASSGVPQAGPEADGVDTDAMLREFAMMTGSELLDARAAMEAADWDISRAVNRYFEEAQPNPHDVAPCWLGSGLEEFDFLGPLERQIPPLARIICFTLYWGN